MYVNIVHRHTCTRSTCVIIQYYTYYNCLHMTSTIHVHLHVHDDVMYVQCTWICTLYTVGIVKMYSYSVLLIYVHTCTFYRIERCALAGQRNVQFTRSEQHHPHDSPSDSRVRSVPGSPTSTQNLYSNQIKFASILSLFD